jgi:hypothetical protein
MTTPHQPSAATPASGLPTTSHHDQAAGPRDRAVGHRTRQVVAATAGVFIATLFLTACSNPDSGPSLPPRQTSWAPVASATPTLSAKDRDVVNAKKTYLASIAADNQVEQAGMVGWEEKVLPYLGGSVRPIMGGFYHDALQKGWRQIGERKVASIAPVDYKDDLTTGGYSEVVLRVCIDRTGVSVVDGNGAPVSFSNDDVKRQVLDMTIGRGPDGLWTVNQLDDPREGPPTC